VEFHRFIILRRGNPTCFLPGVEELRKEKSEKFVTLGVTGGKITNYELRITNFSGRNVTWEVTKNEGG
jgi:hypothetical protein